LAGSRRITPDYASYLRIVKLVSVLVFVWTLRLLNPLLHVQFGLEAEVGIEPTHTAFAEPCLTTWLLRQTDERSIIECIHPASASSPVSQSFLIAQLAAV